MVKNKDKVTREEMVKWAVEHPTPGRAYAGSPAIVKQFGCSHHEARAVVAAARRAIAGEQPGPVEVKAPALSASRKFDPLDPAYRAPTITKLRKAGMSLSELAQFLGENEDRALDMVRSLKGSGHNLEDVEGRYRISGKLRPDTVPHMLDFGRLRTPERCIGVVADCHLASTQQRLDVLEMAYEEFKRQKVECVLNAGNILDGYREHINGGEVLFRNAEDQMVYLADHYPQRRGIRTLFITGDCHEGWWARPTGLVIGHSIQNAAERAGRSDLEYIGHTERDLPFTYGSGRITLRVFHPGGGSAYAQSYRAQKIVESYQGGEKPHILVIGHYHKLGWFYPRGVVCLLAGCVQDQTRWMRGRSIEAHVGFSVLRFRQDKKGGISGFTAQTFPFYDRGYHLDAGEWETAVAAALQK